MLRKWQDLPEYMKNSQVRQYYNILAKKRTSLCIKRGLDVIIAMVLLIILAIPMVVIGIMVKVDSRGPIFFRQERITAYGKKFRIHKFRTMVADASHIGAAVTVDKDPRITRVGAKLRSCRLDELPQLIDVIAGDMTFVGTRPEATKYVRKYTPEMYATLLLPAGITSEASIRYKDEARLLSGAVDADQVYVQDILPEKMKYNLMSIRKYSLLRDVRTFFRTALAVLGKDYDVTG